MAEAQGVSEANAVLKEHGRCRVSAPTSLAIATAEAANITLVAVARADGFEIFTQPQRIQSAPRNSKVAGDAA